MDKEKLHCKGSSHWIYNVQNDGRDTIVHFYGNDKIIEQAEPDVLLQARNTASLPNIRYLGYTPDVHVGMGTCIGTVAVWEQRDAIISPSIVGSDIGCGMRVLLTPLRAADTGRDTLRRLMKEVEGIIPTGAGKVRSFGLDRAIYDEMLAGDFDSLLSEYTTGQNYKRDRERMEFTGLSGGRQYISQKAYGRGYETIGTLGGGNHFIEFQEITIDDREDNEAARQLAEKWGLFDGQLAVMIHTGSRGGGHQVADDFVRSFREELRLWGIKLPDPNLAYAPLPSALGQSYYRAMNTALNMAAANRVLITWGIRKAFRNVLKLDADDMPLLYDVTHNYAMLEAFEGKLYMIHRKGATRALPARHHLLRNTCYYETGHPVLIPGSMGTSSYILAGQSGGRETFYSVNHGAGRVMSRAGARASITNKALEEAMEGILINERNLENVKDEAPQAYKDIDEIIGSVEAAGLARTVARCRPLAVMKGIE